MRVCVYLFSLTVTKYSVIHQVTPGAGNKAVAITRLSQNLCRVDEVHLCYIKEHSNAPCVYGVPWISSVFEGWTITAGVNQI